MSTRKGLATLATENQGFCKTLPHGCDEFRVHTVAPPYLRAKQTTLHHSIIINASGMTPNFRSLFSTWVSSTTHLHQGFCQQRCHHKIASFYVNGQCYFPYAAEAFIIASAISVLLASRLGSRSGDCPLDKSRHTDKTY